MWLSTQFSSYLLGYTNPHGSMVCTCFMIKLNVLNITSIAPLLFAYIYGCVNLIVLLLISRCFIRNINKSSYFLYSYSLSLVYLFLSSLISLISFHYLFICYLLFFDLQHVISTMLLFPEPEILNLLPLEPGVPRFISRT